MKVNKKIMRKIYFLWKAAIKLEWIDKNDVLHFNWDKTIN